MEQALKILGKKETESGRKESYQLLINLSYTSQVYEPSSRNRNSFYEELSDVFVEKLLEETSKRRKDLPIGRFNGLFINPETGHNEKVSPLEDTFVEQFSRMVFGKLDRILKPQSTHTISITSPYTNFSRN